MGPALFARIWLARRPAVEDESNERDAPSRFRARIERAASTTVWRAIATRKRHSCPSEGSAGGSPEGAVIARR